MTKLPEDILPYKPAWWNRSGHLQTTLVGFVCGNRPTYRATQHMIDLRDGEQLVVHEEEGGILPPDAPLVILIHGLGGDHTSPYLQRLAAQLRASSHRVWRVDLRGCGAGLKLASKPANAGRSSDLADILLAAQQVYPSSQIKLVGFSLSGNIVLKLLGEAGSGVFPGIELNRLVQAIAFAPPADLHACANNMDRWSRRLYSYYYLRMLDKQVAQRREHWGDWRAIPVEPKPKTIRQFDAKYTAPLSGYRDTNHYYSDASAAPWLKHVRTPTLVVADLHDPIIPYRSLKQALEGLPSIQLLSTRRGGHMGYFGRDASGKTIRWMEHAVFNLVKSANLPQESWS